MVQAVQLQYCYGSHVALTDVSFTLPDTGIVCVLGLNGAGKTTLLKILAGYQYPQVGDVSVCGMSLVDQPQDVRRFIGYMPERSPLYEAMTPSQYLRFISMAKNVPSATILDEIKRVATITGIESVLSTRIRSLSHGYRQRVSLAQAIVTTPDVLILDEPANGLDPLQIQEFRTKIRSYAERHLVILSTHILPEAEELADLMLILHKGKCVDFDTLPNILVKTETTSLEHAFSVITGGSDA